ncbi:MAG: hypothetical protein HY074_14710 [Deltaproteobacteria bacterium]|nr:hypothetical protein [Deltaproteobacteria bacterium]
MKSTAAATIETLVRERKTRAAGIQIRKYLRSPNARGDFKSLIQACDWYRRLGLFREAFLLVADSLQEALPVGKDFSTRQPRGRKILWAARLLNLLGASPQALMLARKLVAHDAESNQVLANIFLANFEYEPAYAHFQQMSKLDEEPESYRSSINRLSLADSLAGLKRFDEAIAVARAIVETKRAAGEILLTGIALEAWGEYLARCARWQEALPLLEKARTCFPADDRTPDRAILDKWEGYVAFNLGDRARGTAKLKEAAASLRGLALRPEAWLDVFRLLDEVGALTPSEQARLTHYPGLSAGFTDFLKHAPARFGNEACPLQLDVDADEFRERGRWVLGLNHELRLLASLRIAEDWGLSLERAKAVIWPEEVYAYPQLEARLHKLIARLRTTYKAGIEVRDRIIFLSPASIEAVSVSIGFPKTGPSFLRQHSEFAAKDLSEYYDLSRSQAAVRLREWQERGWIRPVGHGARLRYVMSTL